MASNGYPGSYEKGTEIVGLANLPSDSNFMCFHAGTVEKNGKVEANGGRVLNITTRAETLVKAQKNAYEMEDILFQFGAIDANTLSVIMQDFENDMNIP